ncbi:polysaccharide deacetylase family protein [Halieaceae bacterium IMCC11814]|uniref:Polysaccharide deacetylase family protein n=2 Tax=Candidatus Marimicrobium litorale TaxID=2518991 RepID=A0ABT3T0X6_9GAMM|nr:polysaccharide deacetylase family protein [Candidatus Marimicrobium litorale]
MLPLALGTRGKQRLSILIYHRVVTEFDPMRPAEPTREIFDWQMRLVRQHFHPLSLLEALDKLESGQLPERAICVTFDDGYADNELHAMPILKKYAVPATVFVSPGFLNGGRMWNDSLIEFFRCFRGDSLDLNELGLGRHDTANMDARLASAERVIGEIKYRDPAERVQLVEQIQDWFEGEGRPDDLMMTDAQVRSLASNGISIGAHTVNHPILASVTDEVAHREIQDSKARLEDMLQQSVDVFAYPNGQPGQDYRKEHVAMVKSLGFRAAVSTHWGVSDRENDCYQLPRFTPWDKQPSRFAGRLLLNYREIGVPGL